jgi:long-chain acyl-CoA synthetase
VPGEPKLAFLPMCHVAERVGGYYMSIGMGPVMNFAESPETVPDNIREVQPATFLAVPRVWEKFYSGTMIALKDATPLEQWAYEKAIGVGYAAWPTRASNGASRRRSKALKFDRLLAGAEATCASMIGVDRCRCAVHRRGPDLARV